MTRHVAVLSSGGAAAIAHPQSVGGTTSQSLDYSSGGGGIQDALLRTVQEDRVCSDFGACNDDGESATSRLDSCCRRAVLTRPASFSVGEGFPHHRGERAMTRSRTMSCETDLPRLVDSGKVKRDEGDALPRHRDSLFGTSAVTTPNTGEAHEAGFPQLLRRRTFTEDTTSAQAVEHMSSGGSVGRDGRSGRPGRVPMSVSEDNMLALLASDRTGIANTKKNLAREGEKMAADSSTRARVAPNWNDGGGGGAAKAWWDPNGAAATRARRNTFVMRWVQV